jgi:hypothetical protein
MYLIGSWQRPFVGSCEHGNEFSRFIKEWGIPWLVQWLSRSQEELCSCLMNDEAWKLKCFGTSASALSHCSSTSSLLAPQFVSRWCLFSRTRSANPYLEKTQDNLDGIWLQRKGSTFLEQHRNKHISHEMLLTISQCLTFQNPSGYYIYHLL